MKKSTRALTPLAPLTAQAERKLVLLEAKAAQANATEQTLDDATLTVMSGIASPSLSVVIVVMTLKRVVVLHPLSPLHPVVPAA